MPFARFRSAALVALAAVLVLAAPVRADEIDVRNARLAATEEGYALDADFEFELNPRLEDALAKGVPLFFVVEFEAERPRWYWWNERVVQRTLATRLSYNAITRQYRVSAGGALAQSFASLAEAQRAVSRVRDWLVLERGQTRADETYLIALRMRLDLTQMPKPFQVSAIANRDWTLASDWKRWRFTPPERPSR
ncbi:MAG: DUF4390 domain-containing protein [Burkholderiales bacterium]|jgi:hypothetical protein|nr:DUF4390 domain-containing protein [Burkholderiales bacterium]